MGDIIVILLLYFLCSAFYAFHPVKLSIGILAIAFATELLQYLQITAYLGLEHNKAVQIVFGSVFDSFDLLAYTIGVILVFFIDNRILKKFLFPKN